MENRHQPVEQPYLSLLLDALYSTWQKNNETIGFEEVDRQKRRRQLTEKVLHNWSYQINLDTL